jgi:glycosyltransferase involved in cell wall biosynthesis
MTEPAPPRFTIIVAVYNGAETLARCIESVARQTYPNRELIVMDGGSTDGTVAILEANAAHLAYWESQSDRGIYHAWNKGLARATGDWICFLGADDRFWDDRVLECLAARLPNASTGPRIVYGQVAVVSKQGAVLHHLGKPWEEAGPEFTRQMSIPHSGTLHHRAVFAEHGVFDESFRIAADYDLMLRELPARPALFVPDVVTIAFQHGGLSNTPSAMAAMLGELARIRKKHGLPDPLAARFSKMRIKMALCAVIVRCCGESGFRRIADGWRRATGRPTAWE